MFLSYKIVLSSKEQTTVFKNSLQPKFSHFTLIASQSLTQEDHITSCENQMTTPPITNWQFIHIIILYIK